MRLVQSKRWVLVLAIAYGAGCTAEEPARKLGAEHYAGAAAAPAPEVHTGTIAMAAGVGDAITSWHTHTAIRIAPRTTERDHVQFGGGGGCANCHP